MTINTDGFKSKMKSVKNASKQRRIMTKIGDATIVWIKDNFKKEGIEKKWKSLSKNTRAGDRSGGGGILQRTGRLRDSFHMFQLSERTVTVGSQLKIASIHEAGAKPYTMIPGGKRFKFPVSVLSTGASSVGDGEVVAQGPHIIHPGFPRRQMLPSKKMQKVIALDVIKKEFTSKIKGK